MASIPSPFPSYLISTDPSTYPATFALAALAKDASWTGGLIGYIYVRDHLPFPPPPLLIPPSLVITVATQYPDLPFAYFNSVILPHHDLRKLGRLSHGGWEEWKPLNLRIPPLIPLITAKLGPTASQQKNMILTKVGEGAAQGKAEMGMIYLARISLLILPDPMLPLGCLTWSQ